MTQTNEYVSARELLPAAIIAAGQIVAAQVANGSRHYDTKNVDTISGPMYELVAKLVDNGRQIAGMYYERPA